MYWLIAAALLVQDPTAEPLARVRSANFAIDLPAGWRDLSPDEAATLRTELPADMGFVAPGRQRVIGAVDRWLAEGFDGRGLVATVGDGALQADGAGIEQLRAHWRDSRAAEPRSVEQAEIVPIGDDGRPGILCRMRTRRAPEEDLLALEAYVGTGKKVLILSLRAAESRWPEAEPEFRRWLATLALARPARDPEELEDRLLYAAFVGALVGLVLLALSRARRAG